ncbi:NRTN protein, partial [Cisticola juncidis]|nr:NRTN protein [Cisticola juncidis]
MFSSSREFSPLPSSRDSSSSSSSSSSLPAAPRRSPRALPRRGSLLAQCKLLLLLQNPTNPPKIPVGSFPVLPCIQTSPWGGFKYKQEAPDPKFCRAGGRRKRARARHKPCELRQLQVSVSDLGLGYQSDETVLFRYCSGTCEAAARSYDLSLKSMRSRRKIRKEKVRARPCCRPLSYDDDVSFLDAYNRYYTVNELSAKECGCV